MATRSARFSKFERFRHWVALRKAQMWLGVLRKIHGADSPELVQLEAKLRSAEALYLSLLAADTHQRQVEKEQKFLTKLEKADPNRNR